MKLVKFIWYRITSLMSGDSANTNSDPGEKVNVGITSVVITFEDNTSISHKVRGEVLNTRYRAAIPSIVMAKNFMANTPKRDYRFYNEAGTKMTYKDIRTMELGPTEECYEYI